MTDFKDPIAEKNIEMKEDERIREEGRISGYDIYSMNAETVRICRENEKKKPIRWPDDHEAYIDKIFGIR